MIPKTLVALATCLFVATPVASQGVVIAGGTPSAVVDGLKAQLLPQGFQLVSANDKSALFALDRGMVQQQGNQMVRGALIHIVLEFTARFKQKDQGLQVTASEEVVGNPGSRLQFRKPVESYEERQSMQQLLDAIKTDLEAHRSPKDSTSKPASTPH